MILSIWILLIFVGVIILLQTFDNTSYKPLYGIIALIIFIMVSLTSFTIVGLESYEAEVFAYMFSAIASFCLIQTLIGAIEFIKIKKQNGGI